MDNIAKEHIFRNKIKYTWIAILTLVIIFSIYLYFAGYRFKDNYTLGKAGSLTIQIPMPLTAVYIDNTQKIETTKDNEIIKVTLSPRTHSVIVGKDGYYPWTKDFVVPSKGNITLSPIFVSQNASGQIITQKDPEYWKIRSEIIRVFPPTQKAPLISADKKFSLWLDDNAITISDGVKITKVIQPDTIIENIAFYKDRNDAVIFSTENSIYVIETDTVGAQNFMPIYRGTEPNFIKTDPDFIYVLDGNNLMQIVI